VLRDHPGRTGGRGPHGRRWPDAHLLAAHASAVTAGTGDRGDVQLPLRVERLPVASAGDQLRPATHHPDWTAGFPAPIRHPRALPHGRSGRRHAAVPDHVHDLPEIAGARHRAHRTEGLTMTDWFRDAIFYQIFPERFANADPTLNPPDTQPWGGAPTRENFF